MKGATLYLYINDGFNTVSVMTGKGAFDLYNVGMQVTVGYIGHKTVNIRPGIAENEDQPGSSRFIK